jgi:ATP-dependent helicase HrpB
VSRSLRLPVDDILPDILSSLRRTSNLVLEAPPGAGKTTRVPPALLDIFAGEILVLEPRRIAARMAARRVASERGEQIADIVGYQVRFEDRTGPRTRLRFVTEGILNRRLLSDPHLKGVDAVVLDEFHERHLDTDLALALLKRLQRQRPELRLVVMSATLDAAPIARFLGDCPVLRSEGRLFPLTIRHMPYTAASLGVQVRDAATELLTSTTGSILAFLPGLSEIRRAQRDCDSLTQRFGIRVLPLHGDLTPAEQDLAVSPSSDRRLILATNVAESSITVEGVNAVIDSGLARHASYSPWNGLPSINIARISKASVTQRAGRAGRTGPGTVVRLYAEQDLALRPDHDAPEILRTDLLQLVLTLRAMGLPPAQELDWLDAPPVPALAAAEDILDRLGATGTRAAELARFPLPPRLARVILDAVDRGVGTQACRTAALLSLGVRSTSTDLLTTLDTASDPRLSLQTQQLLRAARVSSAPQNHEDDALLLAILTGFPDRIGRKRAGTQARLANGSSADFAADPPPYEFFVALDAEERSDQPLPLIRLTARVEPEWLLELFPNRISERIEITWNRSAQRAEKLTTLLYDQLVLDETRAPAPAAEAAAVLARQALAGGIDQLIDKDAFNRFEERTRFAGLEPPDLAATLTHLCTDLGLSSLSALRDAARNLLALLEAQTDQRLLNERAPAALRLPSGRIAPIHYEPGKSPWVESRLQDFFGLTETPRLGPERTPIVIHLLAPNHRAVQTTTDLAGFWQRLYPQVRRELMRRYPRHSWPENPLTAEPTSRPLPRK